MPTWDDSSGSTGSTGSTTGGFWDWLGQNSGTLANLGQLGLGAYVASQKPSYHQVSLSPEQSALYQRYIAAFDNPATKYNAGIASDFARSELGRLAPTMPWNRTDAMPNAYMGLTPPKLSPSGMPGGTNSDFYQQLMLNSIASQKVGEGQRGASRPPTTPTGQTGEPTSGGIAGDPFGHVAAPVGSADDPFAGMPTGGTAEGFGEWLNQHPEITKTGVNGITAAVGAAFGLPAALAAKVALAWLGRNQGQQTLPVKNNFGNVDLTPAGYVPRQPYQVPFADKMGSAYWNQWNQNLGSAPGQFSPEAGSSKGQPGFGYGLDYNKFYGGGGSFGTQTGGGGRYKP